MAKLIYAMIASLDGYVADEDGNFDWAVPTMRRMPSSMSLNGRSACISMAGGCTR